MSKKKRKAWATKITTKALPDLKGVSICTDCNAKYKGVIKDAKTGKVERVISCRDHCRWRLS